MMMPVIMVVTTVFIMDMAGFTMGRVRAMVVMMVVMPMIMMIVVADLFKLGQIEAMLVQQGGDIDKRTLGAGDAGQWVQPLQAAFDFVQPGVIDQIGLVEDDVVGKGNLFLDDAVGLQRLVEMQGIDQSRHRVEIGLRLDIFIDKEGLRHRTGIGQTSRLNDNGIEATFTLHQLRQDADQIATDGATDAAIVHLEHFFIGADDQVVVDADLAELVDDDGVFLAVVFRQNAVEQGRLAGAQIAGQDGDGGLCGNGCGIGHELLLYKGGMI